MMGVLGRLLLQRLDLSLKGGDLISLGFELSVLLCDGVILLLQCILDGLELSVGDDGVVFVIEGECLY